jgi:hypothetical protein
MELTLSHFSARRKGAMPRSIHFVTALIAAISILEALRYYESYGPLLIQDQMIGFIDAVTLNKAVAVAIHTNTCLFDQPSQKG